MSTKGTLYHDHAGWFPDYHLYEEIFDNWAVYLDLPIVVMGEETTLTLRFPLTLWKELRQHSHHMERYLDMPPDVLRTEAEEVVRQRLDDYNAAGENKDIVAMRGILSYGDVNDPVEKQVETYIRTHTPPEGR